MSDDARRQRDDDPRLARLFAMMRDQDRRHAPRFQAPAVPTAAPWWHALPMPAVAMAVLVLAAAVLWPGSAEIAIDDDNVTLAEWVAPSDSFLQLSYATLDDALDPSTEASDDAWMYLPTDDLLDPESLFEEEPL